MTEDINGVTHPEAPPIGAAWLGYLRSYVDAYCRLDDERHRLEAEAEDTKDRRDAVAKTILGLMKTHETGSHEFEDGIEVIVGEQTRIRIPEESRAEFNEWLKLNGYWNMARVHAKQETALLDARFKSKQPVPAYVQMARVPSLQLRGRKQGAPNA